MILMVGSAIPKLVGVERNMTLCLMEILSSRTRIRSIEPRILAQCTCFRAYFPGELKLYSFRNAKGHLEGPIGYTDKRPTDKRPTDKRPTDKHPTD